MSLAEIIVFGALLAWAVFLLANADRAFDTMRDWVDTAARLAVRAYRHVRGQR